MNYEIIPMTENHINHFWFALDHVAKERKYLAFLEAPPLSTTRAFILENLAKNLPHYLAFSHGAVLGWCDITSQDCPIFAHSGLLRMGVVAPYRGRGIGEALLKTTLNAAQKKGLTRVELTVRESNNNAIALYQKVGFVVEGCKQKASYINGRYENHLTMALLF